MKERINRERVGYGEMVREQGIEHGKARTTVDTMCNEGRKGGKRVVDVGTVRSVIIKRRGLEAKLNTFSE